jgi:hypothetical protein
MAPDYLRCRMAHPAPEVAYPLALGGREQFDQVPGVLIDER